jgi:RNA polymerase sigma-70 factor (ECF subfamily)
LPQKEYNIHYDLIARCKRGDRRAQQSLYELYVKAMYNTALRILENGDDAKDILQESFTDMFMKLDGFRMESSFGAWFKRIVVNKSLNHLRKKRMVFHDTDEIADVADEYEDSAPFDYDINDVKRAVKDLPEGYKLVFNLYMFENFSHREIASEMGISEATSKSQLSRARKKLRELVEMKAV